ncbi:hypothetical protein [Poritiphilus flavus]|uniref:Uncharacterized protein n=1 Tax=Poritiphilus flavus TaxID=2697053 RepID=A0A6L9EHU8_9FLAO|nr:hypothetical protein [Poritiphilus flavus]NAS14350.1 hypothetical protein [Poritiphilus flavus]
MPGYIKNRIKGRGFPWFRAVGMICLFPIRHKGAQCAWAGRYMDDMHLLFRVLKRSKPLPSAWEVLG